MDQSNEEIWKDVEGFNGIYKVSTFGRVRSLDRWVVNRLGFTLKRGIILSAPLNAKGYPTLKLCDASKELYRTCRVHRLVAEAFIPNPENKPEVNHKDGNKQNNHVSNLEWATNKENSDHARKTGLMNPAKGEQIATSKIKEVDVLIIRDLTKSNKDLAKLYNLNIHTINAIRRKRTWKHV